MMIEKAIFNIKNIIISIICGALPIAFVIMNPNIFGFSLDITSVKLGLIMAIINFYLVLWAWSRIFLKKRIALATSVIVIKYAILGLIIYKIVLLETYEISSFLIGMVSIIIMIICYAWRLNNK